MTTTRINQQMQELLGAFRLLLEIAERRRQAIIQHNTDELSSCYHEELRVLEEISHIQTEWQKVASEYLQKKGVQPTDADLADLVAEHLSEAEGRSIFLDIRQRLADMIQEVKTSNRHNRELIERRLHDIDSIVGLYQDDSEQVTYVNPSTTYPSASGKANRFESRA